MPQWQRLERGSKPTRESPSVGIQANASLSLNTAAYEALGCPPEVEILFDPVEQLIGLRAATPSTATYPVRKKTTARTYLVSGRALAARMNIDTRRSRRLPARLSEGVLIVDLKEEAEAHDRSGATARKRR